MSLLGLAGSQRISCEASGSSRVFADILAF